MTRFDLIDLLVFIAAFAGTVLLLGKYLVKVFGGSQHFLSGSFGRLERAIYKLSGIRPDEEMSWKSYLKALLYFNILGIAFLFFLQILQGALPFNPEHFSGVFPLIALNTAVSFATNTDWQAYAGESTLSYLTQSLGLTSQNFLSAATGNAVLLALIRGITRRSSDTIGNFWSDLVRTIVYVLIPLSVILALILVNRGVIQNTDPYARAETLENKEQIIPGGPVASQVAIKQLGSSGGGFFNANGAHPFENPTPLTNFLEMLAILAIPGALTYMYGSLIGSKKEGRTLLFVMGAFWIVCLTIALISEWSPNPVLGFDPVLEGKETRLGITSSIMWTVNTTATSNGSVNAMLDSLSPLAGGIALFQIISGEIIFGGVGTGLCGMLMYVLITVFVAGLMVGRSPEYFGKKIEQAEIKWAVIAIISPAALTLLGTSAVLLLPGSGNYPTNPGPHALTEILYGFASVSGGNGSAFDGLNGSNALFTLVFSAIMAVARLSIVIPALAIAGSLASKNVAVTSSGTLKTDRALFGILLSCVILIVSALTFFPALALGPIVEHILMLKGRAF